MVGPVQRPLELGKVVLDLIGAGTAGGNKLAGTVVNGFVAGKRLADRVINHGRIREKDRVLKVRVLPQQLAHRTRTGLGDDPRTDLLSVLVDHGEHTSLEEQPASLATHGTLLASLLVLVLRIATYVGLVGNHRAGHRHQRSCLHRLADALGQVPCTFGLQPVLASNFPGSDAVLVSGHLEVDKYPRPEWNVRTVHDRAGQDRELPAAIGTLPSASLGQGTGTSFTANAILGSQEIVTTDDPTVRAHRVAVPAQFFQVAVGVGLCGNLGG